MRAFGVVSGISAGFGRRGLPVLALLATVPAASVATSPHAARWEPGASCPPTAPFLAMPGAAPLLRVPSALRASLLDHFDADASASLAGWRLDLNGDGVPDWIVWAVGPACGGTGNCAAALVDGGNQRVLGTFVASAVLVLPRRNAWPEVHAFTALGEADVARQAWTATGGIYQSGRTHQLDRASFSTEIARYCALRR